MVLWRFNPSGKPFFERSGFESVDKEVAEGTSVPIASRA
jgi:hypothetical protein